MSSSAYRAMETIYLKIRKRAREIVATFPVPDFYKDYSKANTYSRHFFETDQIVSNLLKVIDPELTHNLGHGLDHAQKVTIDAGTLMRIEGQLAGYSNSYLNQRIQLVQCAGLLHDIARTVPNHAIEGAKIAHQVLTTHCRFNPTEIEIITHAIRNHEAFKEIVMHADSAANLVSDCLYDADKFRWGPDNFTHTVWDMVTFSNIPLSRFLSLYPRGLDSLSKIRPTFRTATGKKYGPQFIDMGLSIGEKLFEVINVEFCDAIQKGQS